MPFWGPEHVQKLTKFGVHIGTGIGNFRNLHISEVSQSETLTSATYRILGHTKHTVTPIDLKFGTHKQSSVLYKIAIVTTKVRLEHFSAIFNFVKNTSLPTPPTPYI